MGELRVLYMKKQNHTGNEANDQESDQLGTWKLEALQYDAGPTFTAQIQRAIWWCHKYQMFQNSDS